MKQYRVAILGASGAVGQEMMKILAERKFPVGELHLLASARSAGKVVSWQGQNIALEEATDAAFSGMDIVLGAAENDIAERFAPAIVRSGAVFVDNSSAFRLDPNVPLVVPEINAGDVKLHHGIISNPNCSTIITLTAINALRKLSPIRDMVVSTYQAVSGAGAGGPIELQNEVDALRAGKSYAPKVFAHQIAYNVIPQIGGEQCDGYTSEEMKLQNEGRKIRIKFRVFFLCQPIIGKHILKACQNIITVLNDRIIIRHIRIFISRRRSISIDFLQFYRCIIRHIHQIGTKFSQNDSLLRQPHKFSIQSQYGTIRIIEGLIMILIFHYRFQFRIHTRAEQRTGKQPAKYDDILY